MQKYKSRNTWSNRQIWPWNTEWSRAKANRVLPGELTGHSKHPLTQDKTLHMDITKWSMLKSDWLYSLQPKMENLYTVSKTRPGADCGLDPELLIQNSCLNWRKVGKTTRPFRYELNQIPYDYTVEVTNMIQGLRSDRQSAWRTMDGGLWYCIGGRDQNHPQEKEM